jgi:RND family efflux transporter MFP subunit
MKMTGNSKFKMQNANSARRSTSVLAFCTLNLALLSAGCTTEAEKATEATAPVAVQIGAENVVSVATSTVIVGPIISGELKAEREATVRAELGGSVVEVAVEEAQAVRRGALLARIETRTLEEARQSARSSLRSAENQLAVARRETERTERLVEAGALAARELDLSRSTIAAAEAAVADARSRLASAERSLSDTVISAPIAGIIAARTVHAGDVVTPGTQLFTIIDPSSMRLDASVPAEDLSVLRVGATVQFRVRGYDRPFAGRIERIAPQADASTRQVPIYVSIPNVGGRLLGGLFAEGRVVSASATGLVVPTNAVNTAGPEPWVLRVNKGGTTERVTVSLGLQDPRSEQVQVSSGLSDGDTILRGAAQGISPGTLVKVAGTR